MCHHLHQLEAWLTLLLKTSDKEITKKRRNHEI